MHRSIRLLAMPALVLGVATTAFGQDANAGRNLAATCANCHGTNGQARGDMKPGRLQERCPTVDDHGPARQGLQRRSDQGGGRVLRGPAGEVRTAAVKQPHLQFQLRRRQLLGAGAALAAGTLAGCAGMSAGGPSIGRVVIVGGGYGGATAARYLKLWGGNVDVTLIERQSEFVSCPISNLVLGGYKTLADVTKGYDGLKAAGVKLVQGEATAIDPAARNVRLADGRSFAYDRLILSPGVDFMADQVGGLQAALDGGRGLPRLEGRAADRGAAPCDRGYA